MYEHFIWDTVEADASRCIIVILRCFPILRHPGSYGRTDWVAGVGPCLVLSAPLASEHRE